MIRIYKDTTKDIGPNSKWVLTDYAFWDTENPYLDFGFICLGSDIYVGDYQGWRMTPIMPGQLKHLNTQSQRSIVSMHYDKENKKRYWARRQFIKNFDLLAVFQKTAESIQSELIERAEELAEQGGFNNVKEMHDIFQLDRSNRCSDNIHNIYSTYSWDLREAIYKNTYEHIYNIML